MRPREPALHTHRDGWPAANGFTAQRRTPAPASPAHHDAHNRTAFDFPHQDSHAETGARNQKSCGCAGQLSASTGMVRPRRFAPSTQVQARQSAPSGRTTSRTAARLLILRTRFRMQFRVREIRSCAPVRVCPPHPSGRTVHRQRFTPSVQVPAPAHPVRPHHYARSRTVFDLPHRELHSIPGAGNQKWCGCVSRVAASVRTGRLPSAVTPLKGTPAQQGRPARTHH